MGLSMCSSSRGGGCKAGANGGVGGLGSMVCDDEGGSG